MRQHERSRVVTALFPTLIDDRSREREGLARRLGVPAELLP